ncbi:MAG TPA: cytochrome c maturation protein CcmE [Chitinophagaceae bacterium]|nr:cytochrome c maturation protein CcmE [Chitinophagaceae bacterium]
MKKIHIVLLLLIAGSIAYLFTQFKGASNTYDSISEAKSQPGKFMHIAVRLDTLSPIVYDPVKDANFLQFQAMGIDSPDQKIEVIYRKGEIPNLKISERLVLRGKFQDGHFECGDVQTKCPSKYKDDMKAAGKNIQNATQNAPATENSSPK